MSHSEEERKIAAELFGTVKNPLVIGTHVPATTRLREPFKSPNSAAYVFCRWCGESWEIPKECAETLARDAGAVWPISFNDKYFQSNGCPACDHSPYPISLHSMQETE